MQCTHGAHKCLHSLMTSRGCAWLEYRKRVPKSEPRGQSEPCISILLEVHYFTYWLTLCATDLIFGSLLSTRFLDAILERYDRRNFPAIIYLKCLALEIQSQLWRLIFLDMNKKIPDSSRIVTIRPG